MGNQKDDQILEDYLKGNSSISRKYREESVDEPPGHLDAGIIAAAKKAVVDSNKLAGPVYNRWYIPLSLAAVVVITFSVVFKIYDEETLPAGSKHIEITAEKSEILKNDAKKESGVDQGAGVSTDDMEYRSNVPAMDLERDSDAPVMLREDIPLPAETEIMEDAVKNELSSDAYKERQTRMQESPATIEESQDVPASAILSREPPAIESNKRKSGEILRSEIAGGLAQQQWIDLINKLWKEGNKEDAETELEKFIRAYPEYSPQQLKQQLPDDMDLSGIIE